MTIEEQSIAIIRKFGPLVARILVGGMFFMAGTAKIFSYSATAEYISGAGLPLASLLTLIAILVEVFGGLSLILGYKIRYSTDALIIFTIIVTIVFHNNLQDQVQMTMFTKNLAIIGGLIYMMAYGAGEFSLDKKRRIRDIIFH